MIRSAPNSFRKQSTLQSNSQHGTTVPIFCSQSIQLNWINSTKNWPANNKNNGLKKQNKVETMITTIQMQNERHQLQPEKKNRPNGILMFCQFFTIYSHLSLAFRKLSILISFCIFIFFTTNVILNSVYQFTGASYTLSLCQLGIEIEIEIVRVSYFQCFVVLLPLVLIRVGHSGKIRFINKCFISMISVS